jgi:hypothetical protein
MNFIKGIIIPAMVQKKVDNKSEDKPKSKQIDSPKKPQPVSENTDKERDPRIPKGSGNGHKIEKVKNLDDWEKDLIKDRFVEVNGEIHEDLCLEILSELDKDTAIFQVTGFISVCHRYVKRGELTLQNMGSYNNFQKQKKLGNIKSGKKKKKQTKIITFQRRR